MTDEENKEMEENIQKIKGSIGIGNMAITRGFMKHRPGEEVTPGVMEDFRVIGLIIQNQLVIRDLMTTLTGLISGMTFDEVDRPESADRILNLMGEGSGLGEIKPLEYYLNNYAECITDEGLQRLIENYPR